jgi:hypothetical protein
MHLTTFAPWVPEVSPDPEATKNFIAEWKKRGFQFAGVTESFRGYDGIRTIAAAIQKAGKADPEAIRQALWQARDHRPERQDQVHEGRAGWKGKRSKHSDRVSDQDRKRQGCRPAGMMHSGPRHRTPGAGISRPDG